MISKMMPRSDECDTLCSCELVEEEPRNYVKNKPADAVIGNVTLLLLVSNNLINCWMIY